VIDRYREKFNLPKKSTFTQEPTYREMPPSINGNGLNPTQSADQNVSLRSFVWGGGGQVHEKSRIKKSLAFPPSKSMPTLRDLPKKEQTCIPNPKYAKKNKATFPFNRQSDSRDSYIHSKNPMITGKCRESPQTENYVDPLSKVGTNRNQ
jgi:hypothetical protein